MKLEEKTLRERISCAAVHELPTVPSVRRLSSESQVEEVDTQAEEVIPRVYGRAEERAVDQNVHSCLKVLENG